MKEALCKLYEYYKLYRDSNFFIQGVIQFLVSLSIYFLIRKVLFISEVGCWIMLGIFFLFLVLEFFGQYRIADGQAALLKKKLRAFATLLTAWGILFAWAYDGNPSILIAALIFAILSFLLEKFYFWSRTLRRE
jgi:hypothetical protein